MTSGRRLTAMVLPAAVSLLVCAGCGVENDDGPVPIAALQGVAAPHIGRMQHAEHVTERRTVFLVAGSHLSAVHRAVPVAAGVEGTLRALEAAPSPSESARGLRSALPAGGHLHARVGDGVAVVSVPSSYESLGLVEQLMAVAQIVYTVTDIGGVDAVELTSGGTAIDVPVDRGQLRSGPVDRSDYQAVAPTPG